MKNRRFDDYMPFCFIILGIMALFLWAVFFLALGYKSLSNSGIGYNKNINGVRNIGANMRYGYSGPDLTNNLTENPEVGQQVIVKGYDVANEMISDGWRVKFGAGRRFDTLWLMEYVGIENK